MKTWHVLIVSGVLVWMGGLLLVHAEIPWERSPRLAPVERIAPILTTSKVTVLVYHSVIPHKIGESAEQDAYDITPEAFEQQLIYLHEGNYTVISPDELVDITENGTTTSHLVMLTFDDGWQNQYVYALPLLKQYGMIATFYVFTNPISRSDRFMTWEELEEMDAAGMTIASHGVYHPYFNDLPDDELAREVFTSKVTLEDHLEKPVNHFATPFGYSDERIEHFLSEAEYTTSRTLDPGAYEIGSGLMHLKGIIIRDDFTAFKNALR